MSESEDDSGAGTREVAHRLFAAEFDDADFSYSESDEERAPNYVVTPTGARVNRLFVVGVLTEIEQVNEEVLRARVVDPTGAFVVYAGQYQPDELAFLEAATPPLFVAVTGKARTFEPEDGDRVFTSVRPESISEVDADTRDRWVVQATEQTLDRTGRMAGAKETGLAGDALRQALLDQGVSEADAAGVTLALDHYGTTGDYLQALRDLSLDAARVVAGEQDEAGTLTLSPGEGGDDPVPVLAATEFDAAEPSVSADADASDASGAEQAPAEPTDGDEAEATLTELESESDDATSAEPASQQREADTAASATDEPDLGTDTGTAESADEPAAESASAASTEPADPEPTADEPSAGDPGETPAGADDIGETTTVEADSDDDLGEFDSEFELDDEEREEIKDEFGTDFQSGSEVEEPGAADIETPDPEELADAEAAQQGAPAGAADADSAPDSTGAPAGSESVQPDTDAATSDAPAETPETATDAGADETARTVEEVPEEEPVGGDESGGEPAEDVDLEDAVMEVMEELNDGGGADREAVLSTVVERYGADTEAVEEAIQDALMGGRCYEPEDGKLTPI
ncbi:hypothetical protein [Haloarcula pelagica]|uniref:hypothetical protein n=1 Tax=Haloarcula pelagica TaxID=3033389 RepID=UPI0024C26753|nr:hypothetical protein [Halomicroarcula sp. YJ-61-S]